MASKTTRKLTAILCADVVGYSRLMGDDEEATLDTLTAYRKVFTSRIKKHRGRVVDAKGDAIREMSVNDNSGVGSKCCGNVLKNFLLCLSLLTVAAATGNSAERKFGTILALGLAEPVGSKQGLASPIAFLDHESPDQFGNGVFRIKLQTAILTAGLNHRITPQFDFEYKSRLAAIVEGDPLSLYADGQRLEPQTFKGNSAGAILTGHFYPDSDWGAWLETERREHRFVTNDDTAPGYVLPGNFASDELRLGLIRRRLIGNDDSQLSLSAIYGRRHSWRSWELDTDAADKTEYNRQELRFEHTQNWNDNSASIFDLLLGTGSDLDLFNSYWVGGMFGMNPVGGYFRQEFRAERLAILHVRHDLKFSDDRILSFYADAAWLREIDMAIFQPTPSSRKLGSIGLGFHYGVRALKGLPIIVRYAEGLNVPRESLEPRRQEVALILAAEF